MTENTANEDQQGMHALTHKRIPAWVNWVQDNLLMSCLIIAEAYLLGTLMVTGWVSNLETPGSWGIYSAIGVVVFFLAGATIAGVALRASFKAALCFERGQVKMGLINLLGCLMLCTCEFWANLTERATHLLPGLADIAVLRALGFPLSHISPTLIIVAALLPVTTLFVGYTHFNDSLPSREERATRHQAKLDAIREKAELRAASVQGMRAVAQVAFQKQPVVTSVVAAPAVPSPAGTPVADGDAVSETPAIPAPVGEPVPSSTATSTAETAVKPTTNSKRGSSKNDPSKAFSGSPEYRRQMVAAVNHLNSLLTPPTAANVAQQMGRSEAEVAPILEEYLAGEREISTNHR